MVEELMHKNTRVLWVTIMLLAIGFAAVAVVIVPGYIPTSGQARLDMAEAEIGRNGKLQRALEAFKRDLSRYPTTEEGLGALFLNLQSDALWRGPYLDGELTQFEDPWGRPLVYVSPGVQNPAKYDLWSTGPDRIDQQGSPGSDDVGNW